MHNHSTTTFGKQRRLALLIALASMTLVGIASAQTSRTVVREGQATSSTEVRRGEVLYISGRDLVVKMEDGSVKQFTVPANARFTVDGREYGIDGLTPGMRLTQRITTTTTPQTITTVRSVSGTVWHVQAPKLVILTLEDGKNRSFKVPDGVKFTIDGQDKTVFDLRKGMRVTATAVTTIPETRISRDTAVTGRPAEIAAAPAMPAAQDVGTLLVEDARATPAQPAADADAAPSSLPKTASPVPLFGLLGSFALLAAFGLMTRRRLLNH